MKTYNQFITELNKFEAAMKAGKLSVKALKRVFADPKTGAFKINTTKQITKINICTVNSNISVCFFFL